MGFLCVYPYSGLLFDRGHLARGTLVSHLCSWAPIGNISLSLWTYYPVSGIFSPVDRKGICEASRGEVSYLRQKEIHHGCISRRENERGHQPLLWSDRGIHIARLANNLARSLGLIPGGAQSCLGMLMRPKRPSSWAIFNTGRVSSGARVATAASTVVAKFF